MTICRAVAHCLSGEVAPLAEVVSGPAHVADRTANLIGALRLAMATSRYSELKGFQRVWRGVRQALIRPASRSGHRKSRGRISAMSAATRPSTARVCARDLRDP